MTHDEHRNACIEAMRNAVNKIKRGHGISWGTMECAFDALHGVARVCPIEATKEMTFAAKLYGECFLNAFDMKIWDAMSAIGDLTNPAIPSDSTDGTIK